MSEPAIKIENLWKQYRIGSRHEKYRTLRDAFVDACAAPIRRLKSFGQASHREEDSIWALQDICVDIQPGEVVGLVGRNGAGKSTLLKILSRITYPTKGHVEIRGRISSLLEVGTGFHPELTGRDNIYLNGAVLGMKRTEINANFDNIVAFSEIGKFVDTPVKRYSSGMYVRLAFAVAAHLEPEILLVDEVLAVGDAAFRKKCIGKMTDVAREGRTVVFVSHNMAAVEALCPRTILLEDGAVKTSGDTAKVLEEYLGDIGAAAGDLDLSDHVGRPPHAREVMRRFRMLNRSREPVTHIASGEEVTFEVSGHSEEPLHGASLSIRMMTLTGQYVATCDTRYQHVDSIELKGSFTLSCTLRDCRLVPATYVLMLVLKSSQMAVDHIDGIAFEVSPCDLYGTGRLPSSTTGAYLPNVSWSVS